MKVHNTAKEKNPVSLSKLIERILHFLYCCTASRESSKAFLLMPMEKILIPV